MHSRMGPLKTGLSRSLKPGILDAAVFMSFGCGQRDGITEGKVFFGKHPCQLVMGINPGLPCMAEGVISQFRREQDRAGFSRNGT